MKNISYILLIILITVFPNLSFANPLFIPDIYQDASASKEIQRNQQQSTPVYLKSEKINFIIENDCNAYVEAEYILYNPSDTNQTQEVYFPFSELPYEVDLKINDYSTETYWKPTVVELFAQNKYPYPVINAIALYSLHTKNSFNPYEHKSFKL